MFSSRKIIGLALTHSSIQAAEICLDGGAAAARRVAEFAMPGDVSWQNPEDMGRALRTFLREHRFTAGKAVIGLPAEWLMSSEVDAPPAAPEALAGILRIQAERCFSTAPGRLVVDYPGAADGGKAALLVAAMLERLEQVTVLAKAAGLTVRSVTSTTLALAGAVADPPDCLLLHAMPTGMGLAGMSGGRFNLLRHLSLGGLGGGPGVSEAGDQVRRAVRLLSAGAPGPAVERLLVCDGIGWGSDRWAAVGERAGLPVHVLADFAALGLGRTESVSGSEACRFAAAAALGLAGLRPGAVPLDFLHSRLAPTRKSALGRRGVLWAACIVAALLVAAVSMIADWRAEKQEVDSLRARVDMMREDVSAAASFVDGMSFARGWYDRRPEFLECLRGLTLAFPEEGRVWATSLAVRADMQGIVSGKSADEKVVLDVLDQLKGSATFAEVKLLYMRRAKARTREVSFAISFSHLGGGKE